MLDSRRASGQIAHAHQPPAGRIHDFGLADDALVKSIPREELDVVKDGVGRVGVHAVLRAALNESGAVLEQVFLLLFGHSAAHQVGFAERVAEKLRADLHDLFLVDDNTVGLFQDGLELLVLVLDGLAVVQAAVVGGDVLHRAGAVEGDAGDDVLELLRAHVGQHAPHPL